MEKKDKEKRKTTVQVLVLAHETRGQKDREVKQRGRLIFTGNLMPGETVEKRVASLKELQKMGVTQEVLVHFGRGEKPKNISLQDLIIDPDETCEKGERPSIPYDMVAGGITPDPNLCQRFRRDFDHLNQLNRQPRLPPFMPGPLSR